MHLGVAIVSDLMHTICVMRNFLIYYRPAVHEGRDNLKGLAFNYSVEIEEQFANREENDDCAGITGKCVDTGEWKRFRWDRILSMVAS